MTLPDLLIVDDALEPEHLGAWCARMRSLEGLSTPGENELGLDHGYALLERARELVGDVELLAVPLFAIRNGHTTTVHTDFGEYVVLFFPEDCPTGPLHVWRDLANATRVEVRSNRLVALDATRFPHMQQVPEPGSVRYSVALKFKYPKRRT